MTEQHTLEFLIRRLIFRSSPISLCCDLLKVYPFWYCSNILHGILTILQSQLCRTMMLQEENGWAMTIMVTS